MKRLMKLMVMTIAVSPLLVGASASALQGTCDIGYTGPDSNNVCTMTYNCSVTETNTNTVTITDSNGQQAASGSVTTSGNTGSGGSTSGTVTNSNGTVFNVTITNSTPSEEQAQVCTATTTVPATPPPTQPPSGGGGEVLGATTTVHPAELPDTSADTSVLVAGSILLVTALSVSGAVWLRTRKML